ncbi:MAG: DUF4232 domain-containing protein [Specibacter sp.]
MLYGNKLAAAAVAVVLALTLAGCWSGPGTPPNAVHDVGAGAVDYARSLDGIAEATASYDQIGSGSHLSGDESSWVVSLTLTVPPDVPTTTALASVEAVIEHVAKRANQAGWSVSVRDSGPEAGGGLWADVYRSSGPDDPSATQSGPARNFSAARTIKQMPGVKSVSVDRNGAASVLATGYSALTAVVSSLRAHRINLASLSVVASHPVFIADGSYPGESLTALVTAIGTTFAPDGLSIDARGTNGKPGRNLSVLAKSAREAEAMEALIAAKQLRHVAGDAVVTTYRIDVSPGRGSPITGTLRYASTAMPPPEPTAEPMPEAVPEATQSYTPPSYTPSPPCATAQLSGEVQGRVEPALGHRAMAVVLTNTGAAACTVNGYPRLEFQAADGTPVPVTLKNGSSYMFSDPGPQAISLDPGGTARAMLHWGANSTTQGATLPAFIAVAPGAGAAFTAPAALADIPDIIDGSEITVSAWNWPDSPAFSG